RGQNPLSGSLISFSVFGNQKVDPNTFQMSPFTQADCSGGTAIFPTDTLGTTFWDPGRTAADTTGIMQNFLTFMPAANNFQGGDGLNTAQHRWMRTAAHN